MKSKPHVSPALSRLRGWVAFAAVVVAVCACVKLVLFGFIHYTEARYALEEPTRSKASLAVVSNAPPRDADPSLQTRRIENGRVLSSRAPERPSNPYEGRDLSPADANMKFASALAVGAGVLAALLLAFLATLGTLIAAGGAVPGVDRTVSSCIWSIVLLLFCLPWSDMTASVPITGAFSSYDTIVQQSLLVMGGEQSGAVLHVAYVLVPALVIACAIGVGFSFRAGVERGIIVTSISEFDRAIDKEITSLQECGIGSRQHKVVGTLYRAMGDDGPPLASPEREPMHAKFTGHPKDPARDDALRDLRQADPGRPLPRPI